ncbi:hypothetical protein KAF25_000347 [Fusarium avenaceum]|uniref:Uncharacterized protein n=1 Tax=Fusarium avenaceum TaxID=40199 RepID=A0A9P7KSC4_9HYPO|nr:hypothetical protein KAF25_000347 [Fusarium avenaceum]
MNDLREALLAPSPKGISEHTLLETMSHDEEDVRQAVARGEFDELRGMALYNRTGIITSRYCNIGDGVDSLEGYIHTIWHSYYQLSRHASSETPEHDRLVLDIIRIQGQGPLTRPVSGCYGIEIARTVEGTLWNDLPFLVTDMTKLWLDNCATLSGAHRLNFASFLAKLASTRVSKDRMCQIALMLFRSTLEEGRDLGTVEDKDDENKKRVMRSLDIAHLLPAVSVWIREAGPNLIQLSDVSWNDCPSSIGQGGPLFVQSELGKQCQNGFTPWRWMFWLKRLHEIRDEASEAKEDTLEEHAAEAIDIMVSNVEERNSEIIRAYKNGSAYLHEDHHLFRLKDLIKSETDEDAE